MRLEPQERRDYVHSQLDDYGRCYMECLEMFVYRLWSRQRLLLKNCKLYQEKIGTMREVMESLTGRDKIVDSNNAESEKLEESIKKIHKVVWIPPYKDADIEVLDELFFKEEADSLDVVSLALSPGGSRMLSPLVMAPIDRTGVRQLSVIKSQSSSPSPSSSYERGSNNNEKEMATSSVRVNGNSRGVRQGSSVITSPQNSSSNQSRRNEINNVKVSPSSINSLANGHVSVISSTVSNRVINRQSARSASECLNSAAAIAAVQAAVSNHIRSTSNNNQSNNNQSFNNNSPTSNTNSNNTSNNTNGRGTTNGNGINGLSQKESDSGFTPRRNGSTKRSNGSTSGSVPKKSRNNRTKDDKEIVKCCAQEGCEYIERDNANNMRKHYRNWHDDIDYPPNPYFKKEMTTETVNQCLHNWMIQRKKKQPRPPRSETQVSDDWRTTMALTGLVVCESDATYEDEDYEINEHLLTTFTEGEEEPKALDVSTKRES